MTITKDKERLQKKANRVTAKIDKLRLKSEKLSLALQKNNDAIGLLLPTSEYLEAQLNLIVEYENVNS